jgi:hypothetical protein
MFHRRIAQPNALGLAATLCGQIVKYDRANGSLTNVDCPACVASADAIVNGYVEEAQKLVDDFLAKPPQNRPT